MFFIINEQCHQYLFPLICSNAMFATDLNHLTKHCISNLLHPIIYVEMNHTERGLGITTRTTNVKACKFEKCVDVKEEL